MSQSAPTSAAGDATTIPGKTLGIVAIPVGIFVALAGLIMGVIAYRQSKAAGYKNTPAIVAIVVSVVSWIIGIIGMNSIIANLS